MRPMRLALAPVLAALLLPLMALASAPGAGFKLIHVQDLVTLRQAPLTRVQIFDANGTEFRQENGIIPGAKLLSSFNHYDVAKELPADKSTPLVFYCVSRL